VFEQRRVMDCACVCVSIFNEVWEKGETGTTIILLVNLLCRNVFAYLQREQSDILYNEVWNVPKNTRVKYLSK